MYECGFKAGVVCFLLTRVISPYSQEEDPSSSSSEEEQGDQKQNEELYGKAVCVDAVLTTDKKKSSWYPALVSHWSLWYT